MQIGLEFEAVGAEVDVVQDAVRRRTDVLFKAAWAPW
jgi:hypothetical protein